MTVSIIICTRNRASHLRETLAALEGVTIPATWSVEIFVVDNGSSDETASVVADAAERLPTLRYMYEPRPGKSTAQNTAIAATSGELLLFTDDDVRPRSDWVEMMCQPMLDGSADAVAGGVVFPQFIDDMMQIEPLSQLRSWWACTANLDRKSPHTMVGANMAFHRRVLERVIGFDPELGPGALGFCEESLLSRQIREAGFKLIGNFGTSVEHHFDTSRLTREGIIDSARKMGRSHAFVFYHWEHLRSRAVLFRLCWAYITRFYFLCRDSRSRGGLGISLHQIKAERDIAFCREYIRQRRRAPKYDRRGLRPRASNP